MDTPPAFSRTASAPGGVRFARTASGARIAWAASGSGPLLVRAAHWMTNVEQDPASPLWGPWLARLSRRLRVVRYDARGCGMSGGDADAPGQDAAAEDLAAVIDAQPRRERVALLGISSGAAAAIAWAAAHPERVSRLVVLGGCACGALHHGLGEAQRRLLDATLEMVALGWGRRGSAVQQFFTTTMLPEADAAQAQALNAQQRQSCDGARAAAMMRAAAAADVRPLLPQLRCPVLVLHAARDQMVPPELGRDLASRIEGARFLTLPTANHVPLAGEPAFEQFCREVEDFVGAGAARLPPLTPRQHALLELVARGLDNAQIAAQLSLADKSVRNALSQLYRSLGVEGRSQAIVKARELGFGAGDSG